MRTDERNWTRPCALWLCLLSSACSQEGDAGPAGADDARVERADAGAAVAAPDGCTAEQLEDDLPRAPLQGPGLRDGSLPDGDYVLSTTYLRLKPDGATMQRFGELSVPISEDLMAREGLAAMAVAVSEKCGVARTLSVWTDERAMYAFVAGEAHVAAMAAIAEVSRGGSIAMHWRGDASEATWESAAQQLEGWDGRVH